MDDADFRNALISIQAEYVEMPGLKLTLAQMARLCALRSDECRTALVALVAAGFLRETRDGMYQRRGTPPIHIERLDALTWEVAPTAA
jgi:hypothetical protein